MPQQKVCAMEVALNKLTEQQLIEAVQEVAKENHDGHFTIMAFTTGYRIGFYTPNVDVGMGKAKLGGLSEGRELMNTVPHIRTLKNALVYAIMYEPVFGECEV
jgi:uncharacterized protein involved in tellurium resistance